MMLFFLKSQKGLTLLELILAMTMLAIVAVGGNAFATLSLRSTKANQERLKVGADMKYIFREFESDLKRINSTLGNISVVATPVDATGKIFSLLINQGLPSSSVVLVRSYQMEFIDTNPLYLKGVISRKSCSNTPASASQLVCEGSATEEILYDGPVVFDLNAAAPAVFRSNGSQVSLTLNLKKEKAALHGATRWIETGDMTKTVYLFSTEV